MMTRIARPLEEFNETGMQSIRRNSNSGLCKGLDFNLFNLSDRSEDWP